MKLHLLCALGMLAVMSVLWSQTIPMWYQVPARQVRVSSDDNLPGTAVNQELLGGRNFINLLKDVQFIQEYWPPDADSNTKVICIHTVIRVDLPTGTTTVFGYGGVKWTFMCYSKLGQDQALAASPTLKAWYDMQ